MTSVARLAVPAVSLFVIGSLFAGPVGTPVFAPFPGPSPTGQKSAETAIAAISASVFGDVPAGGGATVTPASLPAPADAGANVTEQPKALAPVIPPAAMPETSSAPPATGVDVGAVKTAIDLYRRGDIAGGDTAAAALTDPAAKSLVEWAAIRFNGRGIGFNRITAFLKAHPDWSGNGYARRRAEEALLAEKRPASTVKAFYAEQKPLSAAGRIALALALQSEDGGATSASLVRAAWRDDALSESMETNLLETFKGILTQRDHRDRMEQLLFKERWEAALRSAGRAGPGYVALAKARIAVVRGGKVDAALDAVPTALRSDSSYVFSKVHHLRTKQKFDEAAKAIAGVSQDPAVLIDGDEWWAERRILARKLLDEGNAKLAYEVVRAHGAESDPHKIEAEFHAGWIALRFLNDKTAATTHFAAAAKVAETPISVSRAAYWQGRAAEASGDIESARAFYEKAAAQTITYYGQIARYKLGFEDLPLRRAPEGGEADLEKFEPVRGIRILYEAGMKDLASPIFIDLAQRLPDAAQLQALAMIAQGYKDARTMVLIGKAATQRGQPLDLAAFPTIGMPDFEPPAETVERPMVYAIARQESVFDPQAMSGVGARGLMQVMPATAKETARRVNIPYDLDKLSGDPAYNTTIGAAHLRDLVNHWRGSYVLTIAAYNAGSGNVKKWIDAYGDPRSALVDPVDWVERIPFSETRNYVQRVMENLQVYRQRLGQRSSVLIAHDFQRGVRTPGEAAGLRAQ